MFLPIVPVNVLIILANRMIIPQAVIMVVQHKQCFAVILEHNQLALFQEIAHCSKIILDHFNILKLC